MIFASHPGNFSASAKVNKIVKRELKDGFDQISTYRKIGENVNQLKTDLANLLRGLKEKGKTVAAYGAAAKGNVLLNYFGLGKYIDFIADKSEAKQGLYTPGTHVFVDSPEKVYEKNPDYLLILPWNIADEIAAQYSDYKNKGGKFIVPVPVVKII